MCVFLVFGISFFSGREHCLRVNLFTSASAKVLPSQITRAANETISSSPAGLHARSVFVNHQTPVESTEIEFMGKWDFIPNVAYYPIDRRLKEVRKGTGSWANP